MPKQTTVERESSPREVLRAFVRYHYDLQRLRIMANNRGKEKKKKETKEGAKGTPEIYLTERQRDFFCATGDELRRLERRSSRILREEVTEWSIYRWLESVRGIGPVSAAILLSELDPHKAPRPSSFWKFAGLAVEEGKADRRRRGEKLHYSTWLKSKMLYVVAPAFLKAGNEDYAPLYYGSKHYYESQRVHCIACDGKGVATTEEGQRKKCWNCDGKGVGPKGRSNAHRHQMAIRIPAKHFLADFWRAWRLDEGLPVVDTYQVDKLGHEHGGFSPRGGADV